MPKGIYKRSPEVLKKRKEWGKSWKGRKRPESFKEKCRLRTGEKSPHYIDGRTHDKEWQSWSKNRHYYRKKASEGSHTFGEWQLLKKQYGFTCPCCGKKEPEIKLTEDHIVPLDKGGSDYIENIQPLCRSCNTKKHTKIIKYKNAKR